MNGVKIIHTADCHLGSGRASVKNGKKELKDTFFRILNICRCEQVDFLLIAGDLFDNPFIDRETAGEIADGFSRLDGTYVIIVSGNHDCACADSVYDTFPFPENVKLFTSRLEYCDFPDKNTRIYGAGFGTAHEQSSMLSGFSAPKADTINIGIMHGEVTNSTESCLYNPISDAQIAASGFDYLALGHIHKRSEISKLGSTFYAYCGCPDGRGFDETGSKGIYIGTVGKGECNLEYCELSSRLYITDSVDISGCTSSHQAAVRITEYIKEVCKDIFSENLYKITMTGSINPDVMLNIPQIQAELENYVFFCEVSDRTTPEIAALNQLASEQTLRGVFTRKMLDRITSSPIDEQQSLQLALRLGLHAFEREVKLLDN